MVVTVSVSGRDQKYPNLVSLACPKQHALFSCQAYTEIDELPPLLWGGIVGSNCVAQL